MRILCGMGMAAVGWLLWRGRQERYEGEPDGWLRWFYRAGNRCAGQIGRWRVRHGRTDAGKKERLCGELDLSGPGREALKRYEAGRWGMVLLILGAACLMGFVCSFQEPDGIVRTVLERGKAGEGARRYELQVRGLEDGEVSIRIAVDDQVVGDPESLFAQAYEEAEQKLFSGEDTAQAVRNRLHFAETLCGGLVEAVWEPEDPSCIRYDGQLVTDRIPEEGLPTRVRLTLSYEEWEETRMISLCLMPPVYSGEEKLLQDLEAFLQEKEAEDRTEETFALPREFSGKSLEFIEAAEQVKPGQILLVGLLVGAAWYVLADQRLADRGKKREAQMQMDYPEVVLKLTVLIRAGLTVRGAWERIVEGYEELRAEGRKPVRYVYEEMRQASLRMQSGMPEGEAYLEFGRRTHLHSYLKLSSLLEQNLKKGSRGLVRLLEVESEEAWELRKNLAKQKGEEAGTRMLIPMFLMLILVMLIIVVPAFLSF